MLAPVRAGRVARCRHSPRCAFVPATPVLWRKTMLSKSAAVRAATCRGQRYAATLAIASLALLVVSCTRTPDAINSPNENQPASAGSTDAPRWLPVGTRVPPGQPIAFPPEPYNPQTHGPALPNPTPEANLIGKRGFI